MAKTVKSFKHYDFDSWDVPEKYIGDYSHVNYWKGEFVPALRREFKKLAKDLGATVDIRPNHFDVSSTFCRDGKYIYVSIGDMRDGGNGYWYDRVLFRTMAHEKDWTGGANQYCNYENLREELNNLWERT